MDLGQEILISCGRRSGEIGFWRILSPSPGATSISKPLRKSAGSSHGRLTLAGQKLPDSAHRRRIEREVAKAAHEHLVIFTDAARTLQVWQWVRREPGKPLAIRETHGTETRLVNSSCKSSTRSSFRETTRRALLSLRWLGAPPATWMSGSPRNSTKRDQTRLWVANSAVERDSFSSDFRLRPTASQRSQLRSSPAIPSTSCPQDLVRAFQKVQSEIDAYIYQKGSLK